MRLSVLLLCLVVGSTGLRIAILRPTCRAASRCTLHSMQMDPDDIIEDASVVKKGGKPRKPPKDDRDKLLYQVTEISPPPTKLGLFKLDPNAGCGDCIEVPTDEDGSSSVFVIKKVSYKYAHRGGRMQMIGKDADVKEAARDSLEKFMTRMLPSLSGDDDGAVGDAADES